MLRLNYTDLKHRGDAQQSTFEPATCSGSTLIELPLSGPLRSVECIVEMADQKGTAMRIYFKGESGFDLLEFGQAFWSKRS